MQSAVKNEHALYKSHDVINRRGDTAWKVSSNSKNYICVNCTNWKNSSSHLINTQEMFKNSWFIHFFMVACLHLITRTTEYHILPCVYVVVHVF